MDNILEKKKPPVRDIVKNDEWQAVRKSLLGQWKKRPEWCCSQLRKYIGNYSSAHNEKIRIVMNYLTGTGFRTGTIKHPCITSIRAKLSMEIKKRKAKGTW
jgi:hypothetical protein